MININNKKWDVLTSSDIEEFLDNLENENFFIELKSDKESPNKLIKEISAFANTYGGYIFLGINDDKTIGGCEEWDEERIHSVIHDSISPTPVFDIRTFVIDNKILFVIKIEEGLFPPYITNRGQICQRLSSGSYTIKDASTLSHLYQKHRDQLEKVKEKIELPKIEINDDFPKNIFGYLDIGFSIAFSEEPKILKDFYNLNLSPVIEHFRQNNYVVSLSRVGYSYVFSIGDACAKDANGNVKQLGAGINNFIEIMADGSVRCRVLLTKNEDEDNVNTLIIPSLLGLGFCKIYKMVMGDGFSDAFIYAKKYEQLTVLKQFVPYLNYGIGDLEEKPKELMDTANKHKSKYGENVIIESIRTPPSDYITIDKRFFDNYGIDFNEENLVNELFASPNDYLGFLDL